MQYRNAELKIEQLVTYFNSKKINLSPAFQRGHVWKITQRRKLLKNMMQMKPIPAIFIYKEASGASYTYNILDGKQRLESLILFIANKRTDMSINTWSDYFSRPQDKKEAGFWIDLDNNKKRVTFEKLNEQNVRDFGEYVIPAIEITLNENTTLDDIISLFVDINAQGVAVKRFDIVKGMCKNAPILKQTFQLIALEQRRREDTYYKMKNNDITFVLKRLSNISKAPESNSRVDRMWERLLEIAIFSITYVHKKPVDVLKGFINSKEVAETNKLKRGQKNLLKETFRILRKIYSDVAFKDSKLAMDGTHFYTMITTLIKNEQLRTLDQRKLTKGLIKFSNCLNNKKSRQAKIKKYLDLSSKHTTDPSRRTEREKIFTEIVMNFSN